MLDFTDGYFNDNARENFDVIIKTIKSYIKDNRVIKIKVIGHASRRTDYYNELSIDSKTYANKIQNIYRFSQDLNETLENSQNFSNNIAKSLVDNNISKDIIFIEYRGSEEMAFTTATDEGRDMSNRVMITIYVLDIKNTDTDTDGDEVLDSKDKCSKTPKNIIVDKVGCPLDTDKDGVFDYKDDCPKTPFDVKVDLVGCPLDTDGDGVLDYLDKCLGTSKGLTVDMNGCPSIRILAVNYENDSAVIPELNYNDILEFAEFMKANVPYNAKIIGHTNSIGTDSDNLDLSRRRAKGIKEALVKEGIASKRLEAIGKGESEPLFSNNTEKGRIANRRIEVQIVQ
ncbi:MAG: OmpA family protein [Sulfurimonas sp.]|nr:OmpA family protein [Sulfurimonas sp.]